MDFDPISGEPLNHEEKKEIAFYQSHKRVTIAATLITIIALFGGIIFVFSKATINTSQSFAPTPDPYKMNFFTSPAPNPNVLGVSTAPEQIGPQDPTASPSAAPTPTQTPTQS